MFNRVVSGSWDVDEASPEWDTDYQEALARYHQFLRGLDLSHAGDLLLFFGYDFFHDAEINAFELVNEGKDVRLELGAWLEYDEDVDDLPDTVLFDVRFHDAVASELRREEGGWGIGSFKYGEIDGLDEGIAEAVERFGGDFHSLVVECDNGWISLVFRAVQVVPRDPIAWARIMRDSRAKIHLWGLDADSPA